MPKKNNLTPDEKRDSALKKYTYEHGGPDLTIIRGKYQCIECSAEVPQMGGSKCPGCGKIIDWNKSVMA